MTNDRVLGLIPARGGSKGIPRKNVTPLDGEPLIVHTIAASRAADFVDLTLVSTDDEEISHVASDAGATVPFRRPAELATDEAPTEPVIEHALEYLASTREPFDLVALLQPTSPLRTEVHIDEAAAQFLGEGATSLVSVCADHSYRWRETPSGAELVNYEDTDRTRRQEKSPEYVENGAIYIVRAEDFCKTGSLQAGVTTLYEMDRATSIDIDTPYDLWLAEQIARDWIGQ